MTSLAIAVGATIILLFPMGFFMLSSPAFLLMTLDIPEVTQLLRGSFYAHVVIVSIAAGVATVAFVFAAVPFSRSVLV